MLATAEALRNKLQRIQGKGYKSYQMIQGEYDFGTFVLFIDHVQGDPFAPPSRVRVRMSQRRARFPAKLYQSKVRTVALADHITRGFAAAIKNYVKGQRGTGGSGRILIDAGNQEILERTSCQVNDDFVELRFSVGLPAAGRTCLGREATEMFLDEIPQLVASSLYYSAYDAKAASRQVSFAEDQEALRQQLAEHKLVAFVASGSMLPRASGISDKPLRGKEAIPFKAPPELEVELTAPNRGPVRGMGIPEGVTIVVGGGYHGKSTLLDALARGIYNHLPADGREYVVSRADTVKIRAEDGRRIEKVDISPFISELPGGKDTRSFRSDNASGSTSQAANIVEAIEYGTSLLLMDEDTCATNFMIRDSRMQQLVAKEKEPITPLIDQVRNLYIQQGISTMLVMGGCGDYLDVADIVIAMEYYQPRVVTEEARSVVNEQPSRRKNESNVGFGDVKPRVPLATSIDPYRRGKMKVLTHSMRSIEFGSQVIELDPLEQLVDPSQARAIGDMLAYALRRGYIDSCSSLPQILEKIYRDIDNLGLDIISPYAGKHPGDYALPRKQEVAAALNRLRSLEVV